MGANDSGLYGSSPVAAARRVLDAHWDGRLPVDPSSIARAMRVRVAPLSAGEAKSFSGYFIASDALIGGPAIYVNTSDSKVRQRFTVAHELGHFTLGHNDAPRDKPDAYSISVSDPIERAANQFAAELLMPEKAVRTVVLSGRMGSVDEVARAFSVSGVAMNYRISNLKLQAW